MSIQVHMASQDREELTRSLFSDEYLLERPLLHSIRSEKPVVLLIDEIDKADEEFEAFLLELLSEMQVTIPEAGTIRAKVGALCGIDLQPGKTTFRSWPCGGAALIYIFSTRIWRRSWQSSRAKLPHVDDRLCAQVAVAVQKLRPTKRF